MSSVHNQGGNSPISQFDCGLMDRWLLEDKHSILHQQQLHQQEEQAEDVSMTNVLCLSSSTVKWVTGELCTFKDTLS